MPPGGACCFSCDSAAGTAPARQTPLRAPGRRRLASTSRTGKCCSSLSASEAASGHALAVDEARLVARLLVKGADSYDDQHDDDKRQRVTPPSTQPTIERAARPTADTACRSQTSNRIVPAVVGEARARQAVARDVADAIAAHVTSQSLPFAAQLRVDVGPLTVQHSEPVAQQPGRLALRRNASASTASNERRTIGSTPSSSNSIRIARTLVNNGGQHQRRTHIVCQIDSKAPEQSRYCAGRLS
jgi:hypothetical protein